MRVLSLVAVWVALLTTPVGAAEYYVDPVNGTDAPSGGSQAAPWKTVT
jgi:hypothetical protein